MSGIVTGVKRALVGSPKRSEQIADLLLPKRIALPVFASDALSNNAYALQGTLLVLSVGGAAFLWYARWVALGVIALLFTVVASYHQNVRAYPLGGSDYEVVASNVGPRAWLIIASALLVAYALAVAMSIFSAVTNLALALPEDESNRVGVAVLFVVIITVLNLRGVRQIGSLFAIPTYMFMFGIFVVLGVGAFGMLSGETVTAHSYGWSVKAITGPDSSAGALSASALVFLLLGAFASGCTALTGVKVAEVPRLIQLYVIGIFILEYVVGRWWQGILHNQSTMRLRTRLRFTPGVMVVSVPWQLRSSELAAAALSLSLPMTAPAPAAAAPASASLAPAAAVNRTD